MTPDQEERLLKTLETFASCLRTLTEIEKRRNGIITYTIPNDGVIPYTTPHAGGTGSVITERD